MTTATPAIVSDQLYCRGSMCQNAHSRAPPSGHDAFLLTCSVTATRSVLTRFLLPSPRAGVSSTLALQARPLHHPLPPVGAAASHLSDKTPGPAEGPRIPAATPLQHSLNHLMSVWGTFPARAARTPLQSSGAWSPPAFLSAVTCLPGSDQPGSSSPHPSGEPMDQVAQL